ncbi:MAG: hypothetical protein KF893_03860 [Caldilineaceae bacterium]|nr:hypothetical protein [Caldilineaceae bacterium]
MRRFAQLEMLQRERGWSQTVTVVPSTSAHKPYAPASWLEKAPIPWSDQFFVLAKLTLILVALAVVRIYGVDRPLPFMGQTFYLFNPIIVLSAFVIYEAVASYFIWWKKPLASGQAGCFLWIMLFSAILFYAIAGGIGSIYFYPIAMVVLYAVLALKTRVAGIFILGVIVLHMLLGRTLMATTMWDANMARVAMDESMVLLVLGGVSLFLIAQLRRDAESYQAALEETRRRTALHEFGRRLAEEGPEVARMYEIILEVARALPQTELVLLLLPNPPDPSPRVVASTTPRHPIGERIVDLQLPTEQPAVSGAGAGYATPLPTSLAGDKVGQAILLPLHPPSGEVMGALLCGRQSEQPLSADEETFAHDIAVEAGLAVRYAQLFAREQEQVKRLQEFQELQLTYLMAVAHDMKTPLTVLTTPMPLVRQLPDLPDETRREIVEAVDGNLARLAWSIHSRLEAAKLDSGAVELHLRPFDLPALVHQVVRHISSWLALKHQTVEVQAAPDLPLVQVDGSQLEHVITNLLVNAAKFAPKESTIVVTIQPTLSQAEEVMQVCVEDEGPGVPPEQRDIIFEKFHARPATQVNGGAGLGLWICRMVVNRHGGQIWVEDRPGGGSRFCFTLPLVAEGSVIEDHP